MADKNKTKPIKTTASIRRLAGIWLILIDANVFSTTYLVARSFPTSEFRYGLDSFAVFDAEGVAAANLEQTSGRWAFV